MSFPYSKKRLSCREKPVLGRGVIIGEVRCVTETARRIAALLALQAELDENYVGYLIGIRACANV